MHTREPGLATARDDRRAGCGRSNPTSWVEIGAGRVRCAHAACGPATSTGPSYWWDAHLGLQRHPPERQAAGRPRRARGRGGRRRLRVVDLDRRLVTDRTPRRDHDQRSGRDRRSGLSRPLALPVRHRRGRPGAPARPPRRRAAALAARRRSRDAPDASTRLDLAAHPRCASGPGRPPVQLRGRARARRRSTPTEPGSRPGATCSRAAQTARAAADPSSGRPAVHQRALAASYLGGNTPGRPMRPAGLVTEVSAGALRPGGRNALDRASRPGARPASESGRGGVVGRCVRHRSRAPAAAAADDAGSGSRRADAAAAASATTSDGGVMSNQPVMSIGGAGGRGAPAALERRDPAGGASGAGSVPPPHQAAEARDALQRLAELARHDPELVRVARGDQRQRLQVLIGQQRLVRARPRGSR